MHPAARPRADNTPGIMPQEKYLFAADLGGTKLTAALVTPGGKIVARRTEPVDKSSRSATVNQIVILGRALLSEKKKSLLLAEALQFPVWCVATARYGLPT